MQNKKEIVKAISCETDTAVEKWKLKNRLPQAKMKKSLNCMEKSKNDNLDSVKTGKNQTNTNNKNCNNNLLSLFKINKKEVSLTNTCTFRIIMYLTFPSILFVNWNISYWGENCKTTHFKKIESYKIEKNLFKFWNLKMYEGILFLF